MKRLRVYYVESALSDSELAEVAELMHQPVEQVRIPYVLPVVDADRPPDDELVLTHLRRSGILRDSGHQVLFVAARDLHWNEAFTHGIERLTGSLPYLVQRVKHREAMNNPGSLRILDMEGLAGGKGR